MIRILFDHSYLVSDKKGPCAMASIKVFLWDFLCIPFLYHLENTIMKTPERWRPSRIVPSLSVFLPERPSSVRALTNGHTHTEGTNFIPSNADAGGIKVVVEVQKLHAPKLCPLANCKLHIRYPQSCALCYLFCYLFYHGGQKGIARTNSLFPWQGR